MRFDACCLPLIASSLLLASVDFFCIGVGQDMTQVDLESALPQTTVMVVSVTGSTTSGRPLPEADLQECLKVRTEKALKRIEGMRGMNGWKE